MTPHRILAILILLLSGWRARAQDPAQTVYGIVTDAESKKPLPGVVVVNLANNQLSATTNEDGYYSIAQVPVGRQSFRFLLVGYGTRYANEVMITSGKQFQLNMMMEEEATELNEVEVTYVRDRSRALNDFATVSSRSFSVEEAKRYAASVADPARMAQNFAGVSNNGDLENQIVVRGNSPKGILWRLEGIEIPNPNHFSELGNSGGAISMLNANTLGNTDFYTGAFPAEIGNALSGVFDLSFRNGNTERAEHTVTVGTLGAEIATEGPFKKGARASYLVDYRYSTLKLIEDYLRLQGLVPNYQDITFKIHVPTKKAGIFSLFGLGGYNTAYSAPAHDHTRWNDDNPNLQLKQKSIMGTAGLSHQYFTSPDAYIKTILSFSYDDAKKDVDTLSIADGYAAHAVQHAAYRNSALRLSAFYNDKLSNHHTIRTGIVAQQLAYSLSDSYIDFGDKQWKNILNGNGATQLYQAYLQWKYKKNEHLTFVSGLHGTYFALNGRYSLEPRAAATYQGGKNRIALSAGMHSKPEHISTYLFRNAAQGQPTYYPNKDLDLQRALHTVLAYDRMLPLKSRLKVELYYQYLYRIPVESDSASGFSIINAETLFSLVDTKPLVSKGTGRNYGMDITLEKPLANDYYVLIAGSLFRSTYTTFAGETYRGHYDRGYQLNVVGGKEFNISKGRTLLGLNAKVLYSGGQRESPIDTAASIAAGRAQYVPGQYFTIQLPYYFRIDASTYLKFNRKKATHSIELDFQNITNRTNLYYTTFDARDNRVKRFNQTGFIPTISYRVDFHR
ncbi:MAG: TonB-dependent receptor [Flavipsychrobacter sp.]|nr:TonB-dependent receptor [Flavipsychrobacter sp.]